MRPTTAPRRPRRRTTAQQILRNAPKSLRDLSAERRLSLEALATTDSMPQTFFANKLELALADELTAAARHHRRASAWSSEWFSHPRTASSSTAAASAAPPLFRTA